MKLLENEIAFEGELPQDGERLTFKLKSNPKMFAILSDGIYTDKIMAVIRELSCNARDSVVMASLANPDPKHKHRFMVNVPTQLDNNFWVEDIGLGIDPEMIVDIFWTYGASTKTNTNDAIGALGLGSKSPFAYTKSSFLVVNRYNGVEYKYFCFINEAGVPDGKLIFTSPTDEPNGVRVELAVRMEDLQAFHDRIVRFYSFWDEADLPTFHGKSSIIKDIKAARGDVVGSGSDWVLRKKDHNNAGPVASMGGVPYRITAQSLPRVTDRARAILGQPLVINFPIGALSFQASREELSYDEPTVKALAAKLDAVAEELVEKSKTSLKNLASPNAFIKVFNPQYRLLKETFPFVAQILLNEKFTLADGQVVVPNFLRTGEIDGSFDLHLPFNIQQICNEHKVYVKGVQRYGFEPTMRVTMHKDGYLEPAANGKPAQRVYAQTNQLDWFPPNLTPKPLANINMKRRAANYLHEGHKVINSSYGLRTHDGNIAFIVNDIGERGTEGIRFYHQSFTNPDLARAYNSSSLYFVDGFGGGLSTQDTIAKLNERIKATVAEGAPIVLLSTLADFKLPEAPKREPTEKKPVQRGTIEQRFTTFTFSVDKATGKPPLREPSRLDNLYTLTFHKSTNSRDYERFPLSAPMLYIPTVHGQALNEHKDLMTDESIGALYTLGLLDRFMEEDKNYKFPQVRVGMLSDRQLEECQAKKMELVNLASLMDQVKELLVADTSLVATMQSRLDETDRSEGARTAKAFVNSAKFIKAMTPLGADNVFVKLRNLKVKVKAGLNTPKRCALVYLVYQVNNRVFEAERNLIAGKVTLGDVLKTYPLMEHLNEDVYDRPESFMHQIVAYIVGVDRVRAEAAAQQRRDAEAKLWAEALFAA